MKVKRMTYWTSTVLLALGLFTGGLSQLAHQQDTVAAIEHLGYPLYHDDYRHVEGAGGRSAARASVCAAEGMGLCPGVFQYDWCGCLAFGMWRPGVARSSGAQLRGVSGGFVGIASAQPYSGHALFGYHPTPLGALPMVTPNQRYSS